MSYVFSKALMQKDEKTKQQQLPLTLPNKIPPPVSIKPASRKSSQQPPPAVKRKPLTKSYSVDSGGANQQEKSRSVDLTVVGGSEWKDFVLKRQREREAREAQEEAKRHDEVDGSRRSSTSSSTSCSTSCSVDGGDDASIEPRRRTHSSSSYTREGVPDERRDFRRTLSTSGRVRIPSLDLTQVGNDEWKQISARKEKERLEAEKKEQEKETEGQVDVQPTEDLTEAKDVVPKIVDGEWKKVESPEREEEVTQKIVITGKLSDSKEEVATSKIVNGEWTKVAEDKDEEVEISQIITTTERKKPKEDPTPVKTTELQPVPEQTVMMDEKKSSPVPPVTLPKPRKIGAELKRHSYAARTSNSSISKSFAVGDSVPVIKRSSDMMNATKKAPRGERSLSFDTQTPYFCRLPRALSIELEETLTQCELSLKTPRSASVSSASSGDVFETIPPISPKSSFSEVNEDISLIEASPDVIAMKNEIAVERSKKELERKTLSDTIDEIDSFELELENLIKPKDDDVFVDPSGPVSTSEVKVPEEPLVSATLDQSIEETQLDGPKSEPSDETIDLPKEKVDHSDKQSEPQEAGIEETSQVKVEKEPSSISITNLPCEESSIGPVVVDETNKDAEITDLVSGSTDLMTEGQSSEPVSTSEEKVPVEPPVSPPVTLDQSTVETRLGGPNSESSDEIIDLPIEKLDHCDNQLESPEAGTEETDQVKLDISNIESELRGNDTEAAPDVCPETDIPKTENEGVDMTVEEFSSMINESDVKLGIHEPSISVSEKDQSELSINKSDSSVNTQIEHAINDIVPPENVEAKSDCASNGNQDPQQEPDIEISLEQKAAESSEVEQACTVPSVAPLENVIEDLKLSDTKETNGAVVATVIVDTDEKLPSPTSPSKPETNDKNDNDIHPVKSADMNKELVDNYVSIEHNGVLNGNQMETNDIKLLSEKGFNDRIIFV